MFRYEPDGGNTFVRYDGTETRIDIRRAKEGKGLTTAEVKELRDTLTHALRLRRSFDLMACPACSADVRVIVDEGGPLCTEPTDEGDDAEGEP
jgi:hypothetical protein